MATARSLFVSDHASGNYHCVSRCVLRAWLCGIDLYSSIDYSHRKTWIEQRLQEVAACISIGIYGCAVMSNHLHIVVHVDVDAAQRWSDDEIAQRWCQLFPWGSTPCPETTQEPITPGFTATTPVFLVLVDALH